MSDLGFDPKVMTRFVRILGPIARIWFRFEAQGFDRLPDGPCLLVGNHSGFGHIDVLCACLAFHARFGTTRQATGLMSDVLYNVPLLRRLFHGIGARPASRAVARAALAAGHAVLVYPGGELDSFRPLHRPRTVVFGPRRGYVELALEAGIPIVPLATIGTHWTNPMLPGGQQIARMIRVDRLKAVPLPDTTRRHATPGSVIST